MNRRQADIEARALHVGAILRRHRSEMYTRDLADQAGLPIGKLYPALDRLAAAGLASYRFVTAPAPRRRLYRWEGA